MKTSVRNNVAAIYVRVSTQKDSQKDSPEHQKMLCEEKARLDGLDVQFVYEDRESGTNIVDREEIKNLIEDAKSGYYQTIIFASLSRFSRDTLDALAVKRMLVNALGIRLVSIEEGYDSKEKDDELVFTIISTVNQKLSEQISLSSRRGLRMSARKGNFTGSTAPFGYKKTQEGEKKTLIPDEAKAYIVRLIFDMYTKQAMGEKAIVNYLNQEQIPSPKGGVWGITTVQRILQNEAYIGNNVFSKYEIKKVYDDLTNMNNRRKKQVQREKESWERCEEPSWDPIVDPETFKLSQEIRLQRGGGQRGGVRNRINVFAGMIYCSHCGSSLVSSKSKNGKNKKDGREYRYLICSARRRQGEAGCINNLWIPYEEFKESVLEEIAGTLKQLVNVDSLSNQQREIPKVKEVDMEKERKKWEKLIDTNRKLLFELRKDKKLGQIDEDQYEFEKKLLDEEIAEAQSNLSKVKEKEVKKADNSQLQERIKQALEELVNLSFDNIDELRFTIGKLIDKLVVSVHGEVEIYTQWGTKIEPTGT